MKKKNKATKSVDQEIRKWERSKNNGKKMRSKKMLRMYKMVREMVK
jgi:Asp-tRNA(Asn)/Glu-tRNA(Gln) amidotransferase B subunit